MTHFSRSFLAVSVTSLMLLAACESKTGAPTWGTAPTPPAGAVYAEETAAEQVVNSFASIRRIEDQRPMAAAYKDKWIAPPGWSGSVEKIHEGDNKTTLWLLYTQSGNPLRAGSFRVAVELPVNDRQPQKVQEITYTGRIDEVRIIEGGPIVEYLIIVRDGKVLTVGGK